MPPGHPACRPGPSGVIRVCRTTDGGFVRVTAGQPLRLFPGLALASCPMSTLLRGENVPYANLEDRGPTMVTGCSHGGVLKLFDCARRTFRGGERIHAIRGGLHLSPPEDRDAQRDQVVGTPGGYGIERLACKHCTGRTAVDTMLASGLPVLRGTARNRSRTDLFLGNGDVLEPGQAPAAKP